MNITSLVVAPEDAGMRLDKWLALHSSALSRSRIQSLIADAFITLQDVPVTSAAVKVQPGQCYRVSVPAPQPSELQPWDLPLDILYEDGDLLVVNKQAGLTVHPAAGHAQDTLVNALLAYCGDSLSGIGGVARPGIVHRLDKDTSGAIIIAKHDLAHRHLSAQLKDRTLSRTYHALVYGCPPLSGVIEGAIARSPANRKKMAIVAGGKPARTFYKTLQTFDNALSLMECTLESGRTHQIRVHLTHLGHPLIGDPVYGRKRNLSDPRLAKGIALQHRQMLHARHIRFRHPADDRMLSCEAPYPPDFAVLLDFLSDFGDKPSGS